MRRTLTVLVMAASFLMVTGSAQATSVVGTGSDVILTGGTTYNVSNGAVWTITFSGINLDYDASGSQVFNLVYGDNSAGWENFPIQIHEDNFGADGHLLQAYDKWWVGGPISSHGFNAGAVTGLFNIRTVIQQNPGSPGTWTITPQYYVPTGSGSATDATIGGLDTWHTFYDGSFTSVTAFDMSVLEAWARVDPSSAGLVEIGGGSVVPEPSTALLLAGGLAGLAAMGRRRSHH